MPAPVELALSTLLPTISFLPPDLISLASSLLAQSRSKAASLKQEEEIGRTYACAHIACERLRNRLNLDVGKPTPPVKPKVYDKLFKYLDGVLKTPVTPRTNRKKDAIATPKNEGAVKEKSTPALETPANGIKRAREDVSKDAAEVPDFALPLIRHVCKTCSLPTAVPHVIVGATAAVREIVSRADKRPASAADEEAPSSKRRRRTTPQSATSTASPAGGVNGLAISKYPALLVALFLCTAAKILGVETGDIQLKKIRTDATVATREYCNDNQPSLPPEVGKKLTTLDSSIGFYLLEAEDCGWLELEWYQNISVREPASVDDNSENEEEDEIMVTPRRKANKTPLRRKEKRGEKFGEEDIGPAGLLPGLGTMFQPAVDWLSEERRAGYAIWKRSILREITAIEQAA